MKRVFTRDHGRYRTGEERDFPITTWKAFFPEFENYTRPVEEVLERGVAALRHDRPRAIKKGAA